MGGGVTVSPNDYIYTSDGLISANDLMHYGVLGMKWGVRRGNASKAFAKAARKANKLDTQVAKKNLKSAKLAKKALKKEMRATNEEKYQSARKLQYKANKLKLKSAKLEKKALKWKKNMEKQFAKVKISDVSKEHLDAGKRYTYMLLK